MSFAEENNAEIESFARKIESFVGENNAEKIESFAKKNNAEEKMMEQADEVTSKKSD